MRTNHRRHRRGDPLASPDSVLAIVDQLRSELPEIIPHRRKDFVSLLRAARHIQRYAATDTNRGRPSRWKREDLLKVGIRLGEILDRETSSKISMSSFVDHYLRLLEFPADVVVPLNAGEINLFEASQLARLTPRRLDSVPMLAERTRADLLNTHLQTRESGPRLRHRVNEILHASSTEVAEASGLDLDLEDFDPYDPTHLFWDQIRQLGFALRNIRLEDVDDEDIDQILRASEPILTILARIQKRKTRRRSRRLLI